MYLNLILLKIYYKIYYIENKTHLIYIPKIPIKDIIPYIAICNLNIYYWKGKGIGEFIYS